FRQGDDVVLHRRGLRIGPRTIRQTQLVFARTLMPGAAAQHAVEPERDQAREEGKDDNFENLEIVHVGLNACSALPLSTPKNATCPRECKGFQPKPAGRSGPARQGFFVRVSKIWETPTQLATRERGLVLVTLARSVVAPGLISDIPPRKPERTTMADTQNPNGGATPSQDMEPQMPVVQIISQYIKDLSFENPSLGINVQRPQIDFTVDLQARRMQENGPYEVVIKMRVTAQQEEKTIFLLEIAYGGLFVLDKVPEEVL